MLVESPLFISFTYLKFAVLDTTASVLRPFDIPDESYLWPSFVCDMVIIESTIV